jgi:hypothetical protein
VDVSDLGIHLKLLVSISAMRATCPAHLILKSRRMRWTGHVARMWEERNAYKILVGKPEGKRPLGRHRCRWEDNTKMDLKRDGLGWYGFTLHSLDPRLVKMTVGCAISHTNTKTHTQ